MAGNWLSSDPYLVELHLREIRAAAEKARQAQQARGPRPLRRRVGTLLIAAGNALTGRALDAAYPLDLTPCAADWSKRTWR